MVMPFAKAENIIEGAVLEENSFVPFRIFWSLKHLTNIQEELFRKHLNVRSSKEGLWLFI